MLETGALEMINSQTMFWKPTWKGINDGFKFPEGNMKWFN